MRPLLGTEGGFERFILLVGRPLYFYFSTYAFGKRIRLFGKRPFVQFVPSGM